MELDLSEWPPPAATSGSARCGRRSEIRFVRVRNVRFLFLAVIIFVAVFGADDFPPIVGVDDVSHGGGPGRREGAFVFDREMDLQVLARIVLVERSLLLILLQAALQGVLYGVAIAQRIAFDH